MARRRSKSWYISRLVRDDGIVRDEVVNVSGGSADSDVSAIAELRRDADSDSISIQAIRQAIDSDYALFNFKFETFEGLTDSDLSVVSTLRNDVTSLQSTSSGALTDSDYTNRTNRVYRITSSSELSTLNQNAANGAATGGAKAGDIAFITHPFKAYVLTNITGPLSGYTNTGFVTNSQTGPSSTMSFNTIPPGQTVQGSFAVGQQIARNSGGSDGRVIATVGTNTITTTQGTSGYPNEFSNITIYARSSPLTTWQPFGFDSDMVKDTIRTFIDSESTTISGLNSTVQTLAAAGALDSDNVTSIVRADTEVLARTTTLTSDLDSDFRNRTNRVYRITSNATLSVLNQNSANGGAVGEAKAGDIAFIAQPFKAYVLTNINGPLSGYTNTGFVTNSQTGPSSTMTFSTIPPGQTVQGSFSVGQQIARNSGGSDARVIATVGTNSITTTQGTSGYPNEFSQITIFARSTPLTTWQPFGFDSDQIKSIITENSTSGSVDSDVAAISELRRDADSDSLVIQALRTSMDSDYALFNAKFAQLSGLTDSDLTTVANLRNDLDSESAVIRTLVARPTTSNITQTVYNFTTAAPQTTFTGEDDNNQTLSYSVGRIQVYLNGLLLTEGALRDYTAINGTSVVLTEATDSEDILTVVKYLGSPDDVITNKYIYKVAPAGSHTPFDSEFSGGDENGSVLSYTPGKIQVFLNGILLQDSDDYTATDGSSIYLLTAPDSEDVLIVYRYLGTQVTGFDSDQVVAIINENTGSAGFDSDQVVGIVYENVAAALTTTNPYTVKGARFGRRRNGLDSDGTPEYHLKLVGAASIATDSENDLDDARYFAERKVCRIDYNLGQSTICIISYGEPHNQEGAGYYDAHIIKYDYAGHNGGSGSGARSDASWGLRTVNGTWTSSQMSAGSTIGSPPAITVTHDTSNKRFIVQSNGQPYGTYNVEIISGRYAIDVEWLL